MADVAKKYNSKILLFGEYTVIDGSAAIAVPFDKYYGQWTYNKTSGNKLGLQKLKNYLAKQYYQGKIQGVDFDQFERDLAAGLIFDSIIPTGYGLGSSGALSAAFFDQYITKEYQYGLRELRELLALIESCFHGSSSGLDPLVSLLNMPLLVHPDGDIELLDMDRTDYLQKLRIVDTGRTRETAPLVAAYKKTRSLSEDFTIATQRIAELTDQIITAYILGDQDSYTSLFKQLSERQLQSLTMLIPEPFVQLWKAGLDSNKYYMKLCGAGGGGCLLTHFQDLSAAEDFAGHKLLTIL